MLEITSLACLTFSTLNSLPSTFISDKVVLLWCGISLVVTWFWVKYVVCWWPHSVPSAFFVARKWHWLLFHSWLSSHYVFVKSTLQVFPSAVPESMAKVLSLSEISGSGEALERGGYFKVHEDTLSIMCLMRWWDPGMNFMMYRPPLNAWYGKYKDKVTELKADI